VKPVLLVQELVKLHVLVQDFSQILLNVYLVLVQLSHVNQLVLLLDSIHLMQLLVNNALLELKYVQMD